MIKTKFSKAIFTNQFAFYRFHSNYHHHSGWNSPDTPPESIANLPTSLINSNNNGNNHSSGNSSSIGATNTPNALALASSNPTNYYRDGQFFEQNCHMGAGSPNGSFASASPPTIIGTHSTNHLSNYWPPMAYYQV